MVGRVSALALYWTNAVKRILESSRAHLSLFRILKRMHLREAFVCSIRSNCLAMARIRHRVGEAKACMQRCNNVFRSALAIQCELEALETIFNGPMSESDISEVFNVLMEPNAMDATSTSTTRSQSHNRDARRRSPFGPRLNTPMIKLEHTFGTLRIGQRFTMPRRGRHRPLECCQFWWERDE